MSYAIMHLTIKIRLSSFWCYLELLVCIWISQLQLWTSNATVFLIDTNLTICHCRLSSCSCSWKTRLDKDQLWEPTNIVV